MHKFVQSAIEAANQGDKNKAMSFLKEVLSANPKDVDAWLVLAAIVDEPERKRQCLNRVLALDPTNKLAREELLEMDRAAMGATPAFTTEPVPAQPAPASVSKPASQPRSQPSMSLESNRPVTHPTPTKPQFVSLNGWDDEDEPLMSKPQPKPAAKPRAEKPHVFKYSIVTRIATFIAAAVFACFGLVMLAGSQDVAAMLLPCGLSLLTLPAVWMVSAQVEVSEAGIRMSRLFGLVPGPQAGWNDIASIKSNSMQNNLELVTKKGGKVKVTTQVKGYPVIVETLRQKRPDLFGLTPAPAARSNFSPDYGASPSVGYETPAAAPLFKGARTFRKNFFKQYGILFIVVPFCFFAAWTAYADPQNRIGALIALAFCAIMTLLPFLQVGSVRVEPNKLTVETFIEQKEFAAKEIREIKMQSVRGRYGRVTNYVNIVTASGKNYPMQGFSDGDEIIYGILHQWWESYRNR